MYVVNVGTRSRRLGVKESHVQILSARQREPQLRTPVSEEMWNGP
jgi:hypothetical protein